VSHKAVATAERMPLLRGGACCNAAELESSQEPVVMRDTIAFCSIRQEKVLDTLVKRSIAHSLRHGCDATRTRDGADELLEDGGGGVQHVLVACSNGSSGGGRVRRCIAAAAVTAVTAGVSAEAARVARKELLQVAPPGRKHARARTLTGDVRGRGHRG
jgi:hypothetical protein